MTDSPISPLLSPQWSSSSQLVPANSDFKHEEHGFVAPTEYKRKLKSAMHHSNSQSPKEKSDPKDGFQKRIAFDTVDNKLATDFSLTFRTKHRDYEYDRLTRTILVGIDESKYSKSALEWVFEELIEDGDEMVCLFAIDPSKIVTSDPSKQYRDKAENFLKFIIEKNVAKKKIALELEFSVGKAQDMFKLMIQIYEPAILVVGTRGRNMDGFRGLLPGSVSKYCLQHSPVPVIVVRDSNKRKKRKEKREADPTRTLYREALLSAATPGGSVKYYSEGSSPNKLKPKLPFFLEHPVDGKKGKGGSRGRSPLGLDGIKSRDTSKDRLSWLKGGDHSYFNSEPNLT